MHRHLFEDWVKGVLTVMNVIAQSIKVSLDPCTLVWIPACDVIWQPAICTRPEMITLSFVLVPYVTSATCTTGTKVKNGIQTALGGEIIRHLTRYLVSSLSSSLLNNSFPLPGLFCQ